MNCKEYIDASVAALLANPVPTWPIYKRDPRAAWRYAFRIIGRGLDIYPWDEVKNEVSSLYSRVVVKSEFGSRRGVTISNKDLVKWIMEARQDSLSLKEKTNE